MKLKTKILQLAAALLALVAFNLQLATLSAQTSVITYQGRVTSSGTNFTGNGQFKFAIVTSTNNSHTASATATTSGGFVTILNPVSGGNGYVSSPAVTISGGGGSGATATANLTSGAVTSYTINANGSGYSSTPTVTVAAPPQNLTYTTYWSNDGTSSAGSQPTAGVAVVVTNGLFLAALGDATLANMTALPTSLFVQPNLQLRIWFNDGVNGFAVLSPLQNLTPAPYAAFANVASNLLGVLPASQLSGTVPTANLSGTYGGLVNFNNGANNFSGAFTGNGAGVTNLQLTSIGSTGTLAQASGIALVSTLAQTNTPYFVAAGDLNGDGRQDLISLNGDDTVTVWNNNGGGKFTFTGSYAAGVNLVAVAAADTTGSGKEDLIVATGYNSLTILTNNGSSIFGSNATLVVGINPKFVLATDVNGDGSMDLITPCYGSGFSIFTNNGSGVFGSNALLTVGGSQLAVVAMDVNNDTKMDLIGSSYNGGTLTVFTNNGVNIFGSNATLAVPYVQFLTKADVNGDGKLDLIAVQSGGGLFGYHQISVFTNTGTGKFVPASTIVGATPLTVAAMDVNGDGKTDLVVSYSNGINTYTNAGNATFSLASSISANNGGINYATSADMDGDGRPDLITANGDNSMTVYENLSRALNVGGGGVVAGNFIGNGGGLTGLNASQITSGIFTGNGSGLNSLNASQITSGTVADARLSSNVALLNASNGFTSKLMVNSSSAGDYSAPLAQFINNNVSGNTAPALRAIGFGNSPNGVLSVSSSGTGLLAQFGNANSFVADITANGTIDALGFNGNSLRIVGTTFTSILAGVAIMPSSLTTETNFVITFPQAFTSIPRILVTVGNDPGFPNVNDIFATSVANVSTTTFRVNVIRLDTTGGWSQQLRINWLAWQ